MKSDDSFPEVSALLRSAKPEAVSSPGLEKRILRALDEADSPTEAIAWWRWLLVPPAAAAVALLLWPQAPNPGHPQVANVRPPVLPATKSPVDLSKLVAMNPLHTETVALAKDAERAGNFLVNALPSLGEDR